MTSSTLLPSNAEIQPSRESWHIGKSPVTQWASAWVGRERGVGREVCFEHLLCAEPSVRCRGRIKRGSVVLVLRGLTLQLTLSQICCLMFICGWVRFLLRRSSCVSWIRNQLLRELRVEYFLLNQKVKPLISVPKGQFIYSFTVGSRRIN